MNKNIQAKNPPLSSQNQHPAPLKNGSTQHQISQPSRPSQTELTNENQPQPKTIHNKPPQQIQQLDNKIVNNSLSKQLNQKRVQPQQQSSDQQPTPLKPRSQQHHLQQQQQNHHQPQQQQNHHQSQLQHYNRNHVNHQQQPNNSYHQQPQQSKLSKTSQPIQIQDQAAVTFANHLKVRDEDVQQYTFGFFDEQTDQTHKANDNKHSNKNQIPNNNNNLRKQASYQQLSQIEPKQVKIRQSKTSPNSDENRRKYNDKNDANNFNYEQILQFISNGK